MNRLKMLAVTVALAAAIGPSAAFAHGATDISVTGDVRADGPIEVVGSGFAANDTVRIELRREGTEPIDLGRVPADVEGKFDETLHVPASVAPGLYQLAADGAESATSVVAVLEPASAAAAPQPAGASGSVENDRPAGETVGLALFVAGIAAVAGVLLWASRTHARGAGA